MCTNNITLKITQADTCKLRGPHRTAHTPGIYEYAVMRNGSLHGVSGD
jgi:hypothetical protein